MKGSLGSMLLVGGTIAASLAAASGERPWVAVPLDAVALGDPDVVLFDELTAGPQDDAAATVVPAGSEVTPGVVAALRAQGAETVRVRRLAVAQERIEVTSLEAIQGRVLAEVLYYDDATGAAVDRDGAARRLADAEALLAFAAEREAAGAPLGADAVVVATIAEDGGESLAVATGTPPAGARVVGTGADLAAVRSSALLVGVPTMRGLAPAGRFIDADLGARIVERGYTDVAVRVPKPAWSFAAWPGRWVFIGGLGIMVVGVALMRGARTAAALAATQAKVDGDELTPVEELESLVTRVRALAAASAGLSRDDLLAGCDDLLTGPVFAFGAAADQLRAALGGRAYARVMSSFSTGERRLSRAWSASADGYREEAVASLSECVEPFEAALDALGGKPSVGHTVGRTDGGAEYVVWKAGERER